MPSFDKLTAIRARMAENGLDVCLITKHDPHQSEYAAQYWNGAGFVTGFTGSNATAVITRDFAGLWTDGRYFIQAERELRGSGFALQRAGESGVMTYAEFIRSAAPVGGTVGFDGRTVSAAEVEKLMKALAPKRVSLNAGIDIAGMIWEDRPRTPVLPIRDHDVRYCGLSRPEKLALLREKMREAGGNWYIISSLDDIAWLFNLRCAENETMTFPAYTAVGPDSALLFAEPGGTEALTEALARDGVGVRPYGGIAGFCAEISSGETALLAPERTSFALKNAMKGVIVADLDMDLTAIMKSVKNAVELSCAERANLRDGAALCKFSLWLKKALAEGEAVTERSAAQKLEEFRAMGENYIRPSFETISAYMENAAMMHYSAPPEGGAALRPEGFLLVDSGGQYWDGTTDITRTFSLGPLTDKMKTDFTLALKSHIALASAVFLYGATGSNLDVLARKPMWDRGLDYKSGTGHGIGFCLGVHESPPSVSLRNNPHKLEPGMIVTDEPGVYRENEYGIRIENTLAVEEFRQTEFGKFLRFRVISWFPIDTAAIAPEMLTPEETAWVNWYHGEVYERLSPLVGAEEREWLREAAGKIHN